MSKSNVVVVNTFSDTDPSDIDTSDVVVGWHRVVAALEDIGGTVLLIRGKSMISMPRKGELDVTIQVDNYGNIKASAYDPKGKDAKSKYIPLEGWNSIHHSLKGHNVGFDTASNKLVQVASEFDDSKPKASKTAEISL